MLSVPVVRNDLYFFEQIYYHVDIAPFQNDLVSKVNSYTNRAPCWLEDLHPSVFTLLRDASELCLGLH